jgi:hypothetical protein
MPRGSAQLGADTARIEFVLTNGRRIVIGAGVDLAALTQTIAVVERA